MKARRPAGMPPQKVYDAIDAHFSDHLERCRAFLRQKSVSATGEGIAETAALVKSFIEEIGGTASRWGNPDFPVVYGRLDSGAARTLIVYGMYDVQPADEPNWISPPFDAAVHHLPKLGECVVARGAVNSKGALCGLFNALKTLKEVDRIPVNLIFAIEGEEEVGSPQYEAFIQAHRPALDADGVVDFDFSQDSKGEVAVHLGLKGIVYLDLVCRGGKAGGPLESAQHGSVSAWVASPAWRLVHALATLTDRRENIAIADFYENVQGPGAVDRALLKTLVKTLDETAFLKEMKSLCFKHDRRGIDLLKKGLYHPVININGIHTGYHGSGTKTVLPRKATAKVDIRFGPNMEPAEVIAKFRRHLDRHGFGDIEVRVRDSYTWSKTDFRQPIVQTLVAAYRAHGLEPEIWPIATWAAPYFVFSRILKLPVVSGGLGHGGRQHAVNEYMTVAGLRDFEKSVVTFLSLMGDPGTASSAEKFRRPAGPATGH